MLKFIVAGLPRSGTTWLSIFLSTDSQVCLHDASASYPSEELSKWTGGISDTGVWVFPEWCRHNTDKFIVIDRNVEEVNNNLSSKNLPIINENFLSLFLESKEKADFVIYFESLFSEETGRFLWEYTHPEIPFNKERWKLIKETYMSPIIWEENNDLSKKI